MAARIRAFDWTHTPLGPMADWPQSLRIAVGIMVSSQYPMFVWWGRELVNLYNDAYIPVLGKRHPDALGMPAAQIWSDVWTVVGPQTESVLNEGKATWNQDLLLVMERNQFSEETYFTFSYSPIPDDDGLVGGVYCACTEETRRVLGQRRLRALRELAERASPARTIEEACEAAASALERSPNDLPFLLFYVLSDDRRVARLAGSTRLRPGTDASPEVVELDRDEAPWPFRRAAESGADVTVSDLAERFGPLPGGAWPEAPETAVVLPLGGSRATLSGFVVAGISPRLAFDDEYRAFLQLLADHVANAIASAKAYEEERKRAQALAELDRAKTTFFSNVSHEFRTPLTLMLGPIEAMLRADGDPPSPRARQELELVHRNALRLLKLVNTLLAFSRIEAGRAEARYEPVDLTALTIDLGGVFRSAVESEGLRLEIHSEPLPEPVYVDRDMFEKILLNLLSNALKFTFEGQIEVRLEARGDEAVLSVRDTGVGIPKDELPRVFDRFHRVQDSRGRTHEGTGIGLSLVQELAKLHGGRVRAESVLNEGSRFFVHLPFGKDHLAPDRIVSESSREGGRETEALLLEAMRWHAAEEPRAPAVDAAAKSPGSDASSRPARVLLADDNADMREYVTRLLRERFDVESVSDGEEALAAARARPPDLVLTDIMMPRLDGHALLRAIRDDETLRDVPVILLSARAGEEDEVQGMDSGADDYLVKPFSARELISRVASHVRNARSRRDMQYAIRESEKRLTAILEQLPLSVGVLDAAGRLIMANARWRELVPGDIPSRDPERRSRWQAFDEEGNPVSPRNWPGEQALRGIAVAGMSCLHTPEEGPSTWLRLSSAPFRDDQGTIVGAIYVMEDVDAHERSNEALRESEERFRAIFETVGVSVFVEDLTAVAAAVASLRDEGVTDFRAHFSEHPELVERAIGLVRVVDVNDTALELFGAPSKDALRSSPERIMLPETRPVLVEKLVALAEGREELRAEVPLQTLDGRPITVLLTLHIGRTDLRRVVQTLTDITAQKQAERALRESEERFREMANTAPAMLWQTDESHRAVFLSRGWEEFTGQRESQGLGFGWTDAIHPEDREGVRRTFLSAAGARKSFRTDYRLKSVDGDYRWAIDSARPRFSADGRFLGYIGSVIDVHERKQIEAALAQTNERLERRVAERTAELEALTSRLRMLANELTGTEQRERRRLAAVIHDNLQQLLVAAKMRIGELAFSTEDDEVLAVGAHANDLLDQAIRASRTLIDELRPPVLYEGGLVPALGWLKGWMEKTHDLEVELEADLRTAPRTDEISILLFESVRELLMNVAKHAHTGRASVKLEQAGGGLVRVEVRDEGAGFDPSEAERLDRPGGFGLFSIRERLQVLGGGMEVESAVGRGTVVRLVAPLPVAEPMDLGAEAGLPEATRVGDSRRGTAPIRVLLADDHDIVRQGLASLLRSARDIEVVAEVDDGEKAFHAARALLPDVAVLDINMPAMNGIETTRAITTAMPTVQVVGLSVHNDEATAQAMLDAGAKAYLAKDGPAEKLLSSIRELAKRRHAGV